MVAAMGLPETPQLAEELTEDLFGGVYPPPPDTDEPPPSLPGAEQGDIPPGLSQWWGE